MPIKSNKQTQHLRIKLNIRILTLFLLIAKEQLRTTILPLFSKNYDEQSNIIIRLSDVMEKLLDAGRIKPRIIFRFVTVGLLTMVFLIYRFMYKQYQTVCIYDAWHEFTGDLNKNLDKDGKDNVVIGIGQVFMDFWIVAVAVFWLFKLKNGRIPLAAALFFATRSILLEIEAFPYPEHIVWHSPGFLSLTVPYDHTRDFFYSGHTGSLTMIILQFYWVGFKWFTVIPLVCLIYMMNMLLLTRVHYTIDVAAGLIFAFFFHKAAQTIVFYFDWLVSLPYVMGKKLVRKCAKQRVSKGETEPKNSLEDLILTNQRSI